MTNSSSGPERFRVALSILLIAGLALWVRVAYFQNTIIDNPIRGDAAYYVQYAKNMVWHHTYSKDTERPPEPDSYWAPGYPTYIAAFFLLQKNFGIDIYNWLIFSQCVLGAAISVFALLLGRLFLPHYWAMGAALLTALSPHLVSLGNYVLTETLFCLLLLVALYLFCLGFKQRKTSLYLGSGLVFGLAYLTNPVSFFSLLLLTAAAVLVLRMRAKQPGEQPLTLPLVALLPFFIVVAGWSVRNTISVPEDSPSGSTRLLTNLIIGSHHDYHAIWRADPRDPDNPATVDIANFDGDYGEFLGTLGRRVSEDPLHYLAWYLLEKPADLWEWDIQTGQGDIYVYPVFVSLYHTSKPAILSYTIMKPLHQWLVIFMLLGLVPLFLRLRSGEQDSQAILSVYLVTLYISGVYILSQAEARYSVPLRPEMYLAAVFCIYSALSLRKPRALPQLAEAGG